MFVIVTFYTGVSNAVVYEATTSWTRLDFSQTTSCKALQDPIPGRFLNGPDNFPELQNP